MTGLLVAATLGTAALLLACFCGRGGDGVRRCCSLLQRHCVRQAAEAAEAEVACSGLYLFAADAEVAWGGFVALEAEYF